jgi:demethylmenaquinone methyltransferase/2-methoxy-6-polyprenyl-1,4-benzoquinol methylase
MTALPKPAEKSAAVQTMFSDIAPRYDLLNHLLSLNIDKRWRRRAVDILLKGSDPGGSYLDACAGTLDLSVELAKRPGFTGKILASDFAYPMLAAGVHKIPEMRIVVACADALKLPVRDESFDGVMVGFGVRNLASIHEGVRELARVLKPGGKLVILEFTTPGWQPFRAVYLTYFTRVLPLVGKVVSRHGNAYTYLPESVLQFPRPENLGGIMEGAGLRDVNWVTLTGGIAAIHSGIKP